jgi:hypothetical protein
MWGWLTAWLLFPSYSTGIPLYNFYVYFCAPIVGVMGKKMFSLQLYAEKNPYEYIYACNMEVNRKILVHITEFHDMDTFPRTHYLCDDGVCCNFRLIIEKAKQIILDLNKWWKLIS